MLKDKVRLIKILRAYLSKNWFESGSTKPEVVRSALELCLFWILGARTQHRLGGRSLHGYWKVLWHCFPSLPYRMWELEGWGGGSRDTAVPTTCDRSILYPSPTVISTAVEGLECFCSLSLEGSHKQQKESALGDRKPATGSKLVWFSENFSTVISNMALESRQSQAWDQSCVTLGRSWSSLSLSPLSRIHPHSWRF